MKKENIFALVGPTASGKSDLGVKLAHKFNGVILSVDSLSVYKEIDIASAKPTVAEQDGILHFGIDELAVNEKFDVIKFIEIFNKAKKYAKEHKKSLIIVGGTSFYLKVLTDGISPMPQISSKIEQKVNNLLSDLKSAYELLESIDEEYAKNIKSADRYRVQKALELYFQTDITPSSYFKQNPPKPFVKDLPIYEIAINRDILRERIAKRTKKMIEIGLIDEVAKLEAKYSRAPNAMDAIGIKETLDFLDGRLNLQELEQKISTNTARLAKRQVTFNKSQLNIAYSGSVEEIFNLF